MQIEMQATTTSDQLQIEQPHPEVCPNCGHCPTCGRNNQTNPYQYPWVQPQQPYITYVQGGDSVGGTPLPLVATINRVS